MEYISDSNSESSISDFEIQSETESDIEIDIQNGTVDFTVPDIRLKPPKSSEKVQSITVPPFHFTGDLHYLIHLVLHQVLVITSSFSLQTH